MKRWAILTVLLYGALLLALTGPFFMGLSFNWFSGKEGRAGFHIDWAETFEAYSYLAYWLWLGVMLTAQAVLLLVPLDIAKGRPQPQRNVLVPIWTTAFLLGNLALAGLMSLMAGLGGDAALEPIETLIELMDDSSDSLRQIPFLSSPLNALGWNPSEEMLFLLFMIITMGILWMIWGLVFFKMAKADSEEALVRRSVKWLLRGSILEFLVAVPCHIAVRHRNDCCAVYGTFWGLTMGLSVMLLAFGPGVFFLFAARFKRLRPRAHQHTPQPPQ